MLSKKYIWIEIQLDDECEDWEVDNIHESIEQGDFPGQIEVFHVTGFDRDIDRWGQ